jgi:two-component system, OmpR family, sensor kinase
MSRIPLRVRLALAFALAMAIVLGIVGSLLYVRLGNSLDDQVNDALGNRSDTLSALVRSLGDEQRLDELQLAGDEDAFAQVIGRDGSVLVAAGYEGQALALTPYEIARARTEEFVVEHDVRSVEGEIHLSRLLAAPVEIDSGTLVVVTGASLEDRNEALEGLLQQLFVVGPIALLLTSVAGYVLAGAALRPVEAMRRRAAEISSERAGQRLPLPRADDEIRRLGETLNDMLARLEAGLARERRFVADASHELRTPLASLRTELELALRRPRSQAELEAALRSATEEVERIVRLAEDLLVLARADDGRLPLDTSNHVAQEVVDAVAGRYDAQARAAGRSIEVSAPVELVLAGDRLRLEQALGNLVDNALRHGDGAIRLDVAGEDGIVELRVSDDGDGFPPEFLPHAFERFSRADVARAAGGAGLGLAIVDAVARAHGGTATATNLPGAGAAISLRLPAAKGVDAHSGLIRPS